LQQNFLLTTKKNIMKAYSKNIILIILSFFFIESILAQEMFGPPVSNFPSLSHHSCKFGGNCATANKYHQGTDHGGSRGTKIMSIGDGTVCRVNNSFSGGHQMGKMVVIEYTLTNGRNIYALYAHLDVVSVRDNQKVTKGQKIGEMGGSGHTCQCRTGFGVHLHFEVKTSCVFRSPHNGGRAPGNAGYATTHPSRLGFIDPVSVINRSNYKFVSQNRKTPPPNLQSPNGGTVNRSVTFQWAKIPGAIYRIRVATSSSIPKRKD